jgi:hypothetical protein
MLKAEICRKHRALKSYKKRLQSYGLGSVGSGQGPGPKMVITELFALKKECNLLIGSTVLLPLNYY